MNAQAGDKITVYAWEGDEEDVIGFNERNYTAGRISKNNLLRDNSRSVITGEVMVLHLDFPG